MEKPHSAHKIPEIQWLRIFKNNMGILNVKEDIKSKIVCPGGGA